MIDVQHDSPVPIPEQIAGQIRAHIASGALQAGATLAEYRALAQALLTNPQAVARAYGELEWEGVLRKAPAGGMEVTAEAAHICRLRVQDGARRELRQAVARGRAAGLADADILQVVEHELAAARVPPPVVPGPDAAEPVTAIQKPSPHASRHRDSQGIQDLSR